MRMSNDGLEFLKQAEGCVLHKYLDAAGYPSLGIGHLLTATEKKTGFVNIKGNRVEYAHGITEAQALDLLAQDVRPAEDAVNNGVKVPLTQNRFDALVSFAFNVGDGAFAGSTLLKKLNAGGYDAVPSELAKWNRAGGKVLDGLIKRRADEVKLWQMEVES